MKGQKKITVGDEKIGLQFTVGALEDFQEYVDGLGEDTDVDKALGKMKHARVFLQIMNIYYESELVKEIDLEQTKEDSYRFKMAAVSEVMEGISLVHDAMDDMPDAAGNLTTPEKSG